MGMHLDRVRLDPRKILLIFRGRQEKSGDALWFIDLKSAARHRAISSMPITNGVRRSPYNGDMISFRPAFLTDAGSLLELMRSFPAPTQPGEEFVLPCLEAKVSDPHSCVAVLEENGAR